MSWSDASEFVVCCVSADSIEELAHLPPPSPQDSGVAVIRETAPDVVLLDVHLTSGSGRQIINAVRDELPHVRFLALSVSDAPEDVLELVRAGARGYVTKRIDGPELVSSINQVAEGNAVFSPRLAGFVLDAFTNAAVTDADAPVNTDADIDRLTVREREVMQHLARGYAYKEIAEELTIWVRTVESHASAVLRKLQLSSRNELAHWVNQNKLL